MKGLFIPDITAEMFRNGCLEGIEALMADGEIYDIEYSPWVPVSKKLPDVVRRYLVYTKYNEIMTDFFTGDKFMQGEDILAWMPLPEPYKEEGETDG